MTEGDARPFACRAYVVLGMLTLVVLIVGFGMWSLTTQISGAVVAPGRIEADRARRVVQHPTGGVAAEVLVRDGTAVAQGQVLIRLDTTVARNARAYARAQLFELKAQQARLTADFTDQVAIRFSEDLLAEAATDPSLQSVLDSQRSLFRATRQTRDSQRRQLGKRKRQIAARLDGIGAQTAALSRQIDLVGRALEDQRTLLSRGLVPATSVMALEKEAAQLSGTFGELMAQGAQAREQIAEIEAEHLRDMDQSREEAMEATRDLEQSIRRFRADVQRLEGELALADIRAPVAGIVHDMTVQTARAVLRPADALMYIVPQDRPRIVVSHVTPGQIDRVATGQRVRMRLSALNQRLTPEIAGQVIAVSAAAIEDPRSGGRFFRVDIAPDAAAVAQLPEDAVLLPGMPVDTFIETGAHRPMDYLLRPLADYFARAFRET